MVIRSESVHGTGSGRSACSPASSSSASSAASTHVSSLTSRTARWAPFFFSTLFSTLALRFSPYFAFRRSKARACTLSRRAGSRGSIWRHTRLEPVGITAFERPLTPGVSLYRSRFSLSRLALACSPTPSRVVLFTPYFSRPSLSAARRARRRFAASAATAMLLPRSRSVRSVFLALAPARASRGVCLRRTLADTPRRRYLADLKLSEKRRIGEEETRASRAVMCSELLYGLRSGLPVEHRALRGERLSFSITFSGARP